MPEKELAPYREQPPAPSLPKQLTQQFYDWEKRGRGWQVWSYPVVIEPPFRPFFFYPPSSESVRDDARTPGLFSELANLFKPDPGPQVVDSVPEPLQEVEPEQYRDCDLVEIQIGLPSLSKIKSEAAEQLLLNLTYCCYPVSFEIIGLLDKIVIQICCRKEDENTVFQKLRAYFPEAILTKETNLLSRAWDNSQPTIIADFGLSNEFLLPIKTADSLEVDPLIGIVGALEQIQAGELGIFQVLFERAAYPWAANLIRAVTDWEGNSFFADAPEFVPQARKKIGKPLFAAVVRVAGQSSDRNRSWQIVKGLGSSFAQLANPLNNELIPLANDGYADIDHQEDIVSRLTHRSGMLLNSEELASLVRLPSDSVRSEKLRTKTKKTKLVPQLATGHDLVLGENIHNGVSTSVTLSPEQRMKHTYVVGASGTGKSTLLLNLIIQDIQKGRGVGVLDPHGDLIDQILGHIPEERIKDVILFDPSDEEYPIGFNILSAHSELERNLLSSDLVSCFRRLSTSWGDQMTSVLGNAILAFLESEEGGTLSDLRRFLIEKDFRNSFLETVKDQEVIYYWQKEFPLLTGRPQASILTRLDTFLRPKLIRYMVGQKENKLNFATVLNENKIFLAKLSQGAIGEENAYLLGTLLVSKFQQLAMSRQEIKESERKDFFLYIDEFHNFITPSMAAILCGARKYRLGLTLSHQELHQLKDTEVRSAVLSNPYARICFRVGDEDAQKLADGFTSFEAKDLQNLGTGEAVCRVERAEYDFNLKTSQMPSVAPETAFARQEKIKALSRELYGTKREDVELKLYQKFTPAPVPAVEEKPVISIESVVEPQKVVLVNKVAKPKAIKPPPTAEVSLGRGGQQHQYLQQLIKRYAEDKGYLATIEKQILNGAGSVDVFLEKKGKTIACEISITTEAEQELGNIQKCLAVRADKVILVSPHRKLLRQAKELCEASVEEKDLSRIFFFTPEEYFGFMEGEAAGEAASEGTVRGYRVKTNFRPLSEEEKEIRKQSIAQTILKALKRLKGGA